MSVRDLGYRAYEGPRLPASHNTWVMIRHSLRRAWASWLVKLPVFFCLGTTVVLGIYYFVVGVLMAQQSGVSLMQTLTAGNASPLSSKCSMTTGRSAMEKKPIFCPA